MESIKNLVKRFVKEEEGVTLLEYGLLAALIAVICIVAVQNLGTTTRDTFNTIEGKMSTVNDAAAAAAPANP